MRALKARKNTSILKKNTYEQRKGKIMREFKIGDRVRVIDTFASRNMKNQVGTVIDVDEKSCAPWEVGVEFDEDLRMDGHSCGGRGKDGFCRWGRKRELELVGDKKIVITSNGEETLARLYEGNKVVKSATAKCSRDDAFDFNTGARLALERLTKEESVKPHLLCSTRHYGNIGEKTNFKDAVGRPLFVGDVVEHFNEGAVSFGDTVIVKTKCSHLYNKEKTFVFGIGTCCDDKKGTLSDGWKIIKKRSFDEVKNGENIYGIEFVKEK